MGAVVAAPEAVAPWGLLRDALVVSSGSLHEVRLLVAIASVARRRRRRAMVVASSADLASAVGAVVALLVPSAVVCVVCAVGCRCAFLRRQTILQAVVGAVLRRRSRRVGRMARECAFVAVRHSWVGAALWWCCCARVCSAALSQLLADLCFLQVVVRWSAFGGATVPATRASTGVPRRRMLMMMMLLRGSRGMAMTAPNLASLLLSLLVASRRPLVGFGCCVEIHQ